MIWKKRKKKDWNLPYEVKLSPMKRKERKIGDSIHMCFLCVYVKVDVVFDGGFRDDSIRLQKRG